MIRSYRAAKLRRTATVAIAAALMGASLGAPAAWAQDDAAAEEEAPVERAFTAAIGQMALEAQELQETDPQGALRIVNEALGEELTPYERFMLLNMRAGIYGVDNAGQAIADWQEALTLGIATPEERASLMVNIGQLLILEERFDEGVAILEDWLRDNPPRENIVTMIATALAQSDQFQRALPYAEQAFELAAEPQRSHFDLLNYLYSELNMPEKQADIIREMLNRWPDDRNLWNAWVSMLSNGGREREAFEVNKLMYVNGMLTTEDDVVRLVNYYSYFEVPFRGAQILEREMNAGRVESNQENMILLSNLWRQSREFDRAIPILEQAAAAAPDGELYAQLCEAHYSEAQYEEAEAACAQAIEKGVQEPGNLWVLIGNSRYEREERDQAMEAFQRGIQFSHSRSTAQGWVDFINAEIAAEQARVEFAETVQREECIITIERMQRDDVLGARVENAIPEHCEQYRAYVQ